MFLSEEDLQTYCPDEDTATITAVISNVEALFCGLLPIELRDRDLEFYDDEVYLTNGRNKVNTNLLNINGVNVGDIDVSEIKIVGKNKSEIFFKYDDISFDPVFIMTVNSGYSSETLPGDIKQAMIEYTKDQILLLGNPSGTTSITMGPRKLTFSGEGSQNAIMQVLYKYLM